MNTLKELKWQSLLSSAAYAIMGVILLVFPETTAKTLCYIIGISSIVIGIFWILIYLFRDIEKNYYRNDFVIGMTIILLGVFVLCKADLIITLIPSILGILIIFSGIGKLQNTIDIRRMGKGNGLVFFVLAAINIVFGGILLMAPITAVKVTFMLIGVGLLFSGISDLILSLYMGKTVKNHMKHMEVLELEVKEINEEEKEE